MTRATKLCYSIGLTVRNILFVFSFDTSRKICLHNDLAALVLAKVHWKQSLKVFCCFLDVKLRLLIGVQPTIAYQTLMRPLFRKACGTCSVRDVWLTHGYNLACQGPHFLFLYLIFFFWSLTVNKSLVVLFCLNTFSWRFGNRLHRSWPILFFP